MTELLAPEVPPVLASLLDGDRLAEKLGETFVVAVPDAAGLPHFGMLSCGEVVALGPASVGVALWGSSSLARELRQSGGLTFLAVVPPAAYYLKLAVDDAADGGAAGLPGLLLVRTRVLEARRDEEPGLPLVQGMRFAVPDAGRAALLERWTATVAGLRALTGWA